MQPRARELLPRRVRRHLAGVGDTPSEFGKELQVCGNLVAANLIQDEPGEP
jgi:hypothetical protein